VSIGPYRPDRHGVEAQVALLSRLRLQVPIIGSGPRIACRGPKKMTENLQTIFGSIIIMVGFCAAIAYPRLQYSVLRQMRGLWLVLSLVPLAVMLVVGVVTALALLQRANLWPLVLIFTAPVATAYLAVLRFVERRVARRGFYTL
jgi:hypothetical protein